jgi:pimeloyl-ACP methyl ester carboxylesterase
MNRLSLLFLFSTIFCSAQNPPYDVFPEAKPPYYRVRYEASIDPNALQFPVKFTIWIPEGVKTLKGIVVHQHGCGEGSCSSGLTGAWDLHWQALAKKHGCALLSPSYEQPQKENCQLWCDPRNGSGQAFLRALRDLGKMSGHPELSKVPWALWGHSGGGHWAGGMTLLYPERVAACWLRSGVPLFEPNPDRDTIKPHPLNPSSLDVPIMCNPGTKEGVTVKTGRFARVWSANQKFFEKVRGAGGLVGIAVDPLSSHECGNQRYMAILWFDECLTARLPKKDGRPLRKMVTEEAWFAKVLATTAVSAENYKGDPLKAVWLPSQRIAKTWMHYVRDTEIPDNSPPPAPKRIRVSNAGTNKDRLTWEAEADLESGLSHFIIKKNGKEIAKVPEKPTNRFGRPLFQGLQYSDTPLFPLVQMEYIDKEAHMITLYEVIAVNTVGLKSKPVIPRGSIRSKK